MYYESAPGSYKRGDTSSESLAPFAYSWASSNASLTINSPCLYPFRFDSYI